MGISKNIEMGIDNMKNRGFLIFLFCIIFLAFLTSCAKSSTNQEDITKIEKSESNAYDSKDEDISRSGMFTQEGSWIYYSSFTGSGVGSDICRESIDGKGKSILASNTGNFCLSDNWLFYVDYGHEGIYKNKVDVTGKTKLTDDGGHKFAVSKEWVYYINGQDKHRLYRVRKDGTGKAKVTDDQCADFDITHGDWIYYLKSGLSFDEHWIYKIGMDGREKTAIGQKRAAHLMVLNDWIYYSGITDFNLYKIRTDGSDEMRLDKGAIGQVWFLGVEQDWIYYLWNDSGGIIRTYKIKKDGTNKTPIGNDKEVYGVLGISEDFIYTNRSSYTYNLYKSKISKAADNKKIKIGNIRMSKAVKKNGWLYYTSLDDNLNLYRIKEDGTVNEKLYNGRIVDFEINGDMLYFALSDPGSGENGIYRIGLSSKNSKKICSDRGPFNIDNNFIYYCPNNTEIYRTDIEGINKEKIANGGSDDIIIIGDWVYYIDSKDLFNNIITRIKIDGTSKTSLATTTNSSQPMIISGDWIYFINTHYEICKVKLDGTLEVKIFRPSTGATSLYGVQNGWIYYMDGVDREFEYNLIKISEANPEEIRLSDFNIDTANVVDGWIYFTEKVIKEDTLLMKTDGTISRIFE